MLFPILAISHFQQDQLCSRLNVTVILLLEDIYNTRLTLTQQNNHLIITVVSSSVLLLLIIYRAGQGRVPIIQHSGFLPPGFGDDHLGSELMELVPQLLGLQAAGDLRHLLAGDAGVGGDQRLRAHARRAPAAEVAVCVHGGELGESLLAARGLLHKLF